MRIIKSRHHLLYNKKGATAIDYALIIVIVTLVITIGLSGLTDQIITLIEKITIPPSPPPTSLS